MAVACATRLAVSPCPFSQIRPKPQAAPLQLRPATGLSPRPAPRFKLKGPVGPIPLCQGRALIFIRLLLARIWGRVCCHRSHTLVFHSICRIRWCCQGSCRRNPCTATHHFLPLRIPDLFRGKPALVILHSSSWIVGYFSFPSSSSLMRSMMNFMAPYPSSSLAPKSRGSYISARGPKASRTHPPWR